MLPLDAAGRVSAVPGQEFLGLELEERLLPGKDDGYVKARAVLGIALAHAAVLSAGCNRQPEVSIVSSPRVAKLSAPFQEQIRKTLTEQCGTPLNPRLLGSSTISRSYLRHGAILYERNCSRCHGVTGDGNGPAAASMSPRPRNYLPAVFKFTSTTYGAKPLREDLLRTIRRGITGTSMPSFKLLPASDQEALVDYVIALTHRGELESLLADAAEFDGQIDPNEVPKMSETFLAKWDNARSQVVYPRSPMPVITVSSVRAGKAAFLSKGCSKCHGEDGRGQTKENIGVDSWGFPTKAADLTSGMLRGGTEALDIYRHIDAGINGTPMPSFRTSLEQEPETVWNLVVYVLYLANERRNGAIPPAGILKPLPGVEKDASPADSAGVARPQPISVASSAPAASSVAPGQGEGSERSSAGRSNGRED